MKKKVIIFTILILLFLLPNMDIINAQTNDYLKPGDALSVTIWGHPDLKSEVVISNNGNINLPLIGEIKAQNLNINELKKVIIEQYKKYIKNPQVNIVLKEKASIQVVIMGEVYNPGSYKLSPESKILDLVSRAGGITQKGALSSANLIRDGEEIPVNLEGILMGEKNPDNEEIILQDGDILFVPENTIEVSILGEVNKPGRFEMVSGLRLSDLLARAGSLTDQADKKIRYSSNGKTKTIDIIQLFSNGDDNNNPILKDGDSVYVPETTYSISILGEVNKPGSYKWNENMKLADLIALSGNLTEKADRTKLRVTHQNGDVEFINLKNYYENNNQNENIKLNSGDIVMVPETNQYDTVTILGEINKPGTYKWDENLRLSELLARAGSLEKRGDAKDVKIIHDNGEYKTINFNEYLKDKKEGFNPKLEAGDVVVINEVSSPNWQEIFGFVSGFNAIKTLLEISW